MRRKLFNLLATISLLLCAAMTVLWVRSYRTVDTQRWSRLPTEYCLQSAFGAVEFTRSEHVHPEESLSELSYPSWTKWSSPDGSGYCRLGPRVPWHDPIFMVCGLRFDKGTYVVPLFNNGYEWVTATYRHTFLAVPYWLLIVLTATVPMGWIPKMMRLHQQRRRQSSGLCVRCGYDLRASPARCPECGAVPTSPPAPAA
jgi:hypothetical protein